MQTANEERRSLLQRVKNTIEVLVKRREFAKQRASPLSFVSTPAASPCTSVDVAIPPELNTGRYALRYEAPVNNDILDYEEWLLNTHELCRAWVRQRSPEVRLRSVVLRRDVEAALVELEQWKVVEWERQRPLAELNPIVAPNCNASVNSPSRHCETGTFSLHICQLLCFDKSLPSRLRCSRHPPNLATSALDLSLRSRTTPSMLGVHPQMRVCLGGAQDPCPNVPRS